MKAPNIIAICMATAVAALTVQARPVAGRPGGSAGSTNSARIKVIVTNTSPSQISPHAIVPAPVTPSRNIDPGSRTAPTVRQPLSVAPDRAGNKAAPDIPAIKPGKNYAVSARVLVSGQAARRRSTHGGNPGFSDLSGAETNAVEFLGYRDYRLIKNDRSLVRQSDAYKLGFDGTSSVMVKPLYETSGKIRTEITWYMPGQADWTTKIFVHRGRPVMIGGPKIEGGGIYLLSLTIK